MEALRQKAIGERDSYYELLSYAYALDTANTAIAYHKGYYELHMDNPTKESVDKAMNLMKRHFNKVPEDYVENSFYALACERTGNVKEALRAWSKLAEIYPAKIDVKYMLADAYAANQDFAKAVELYDSIESSEGLSLYVTVKKANYRLAVNDTTGSINEVQKLLASAPSNVDYNTLLGDVYLQFSNSDSAMYYYEKAHEIEPDNGYVYLHKADYYKMLGDSVNYDIQIYNALINDDLDISKKAEILTEYVRNAFSNGIQKSERIDNLFSTLIEQHPHEIAVHDLYSQYLASIKDYTGATEQLGYVFDLAPTNTENLRKLVLLYLMDMNYDKAFETAEKAIDCNPENIELYQYIAPAYRQIQKYDKALELYGIALEKTDSTDYEMLSNLSSGMGDVYYAMGDTTKVIELYERALKYNSYNLMAMNNYAYYLAELGENLNRAEQLSATTVKYEPKNPTYLDTYAWVFFKKGEYAMALVYIKSAMSYSEVEEPSAELYEHYGDILFMNGQHEEAVPNWEKALSLNPDSEILQRKVKHKTFFFK